MYTLSIMVMTTISLPTFGALDDWIMSLSLAVLSITLYGVAMNRSKPDSQPTTEHISSTFQSPGFSIDDFLFYLAPVDDSSMETIRKMYGNILYIFTITSWNINCCGKPVNVNIKYIFPPNWQKK